MEPTFLKIDREGRGYRFGELADIVRLAESNEEMRSLIRVLAAGGMRGQNALLDVCRQMEEQVQKTEESSEIETEFEQEEGESDETMALRGLSEVRIYQFLLRAYLSLRLPEGAGNIVLFPSLGPLPPNDTYHHVA